MSSKYIMHVYFYNNPTEETFRELEHELSLAIYRDNFSAQVAELILQRAREYLDEMQSLYDIDE